MRMLKSISLVGESNRIGQAVSSYLYRSLRVRSQSRKVRRLSVILGNGERCDPGLMEDVCHVARYQFAQRYLDSSDTVLDIACGTGYGTAMLASDCAAVTGVDHSSPAIAYARQQYQCHNTKFIQADYFSFHQAADVVVSFETIEHIQTDDFSTVLTKLVTLAHRRVIGSFPYREALGRNRYHHFFCLDETSLGRLHSCGQLEIFYQQPNGLIRRNCLPNERIQNLIFVLTKFQELRGDRIPSMVTRATDKPTILVLTELIPSHENLFLGNFVVNQMEALRERYQFVVIVPRLCRPSRRPSASIVSDGVRVYYVWRWSLALAVLRRFGVRRLHLLLYWNKIIMRRKIVTLAKRLHKQYNFSLVHGQEAYIGDEAVPVGKVLGIQSVVTIHGLHEYHRQVWGKYCLGQVVKHLNHADQLMTVSNIAANSYRNHGVKQAFYVIPNGITIPRSPPSLPAAWQLVTRRKTVILAVGFFIPEKRFEQVIAAAIRLRERWNDSFVVLLIGMGNLQLEYERMICENHLENHVYIVGQVPPAEMSSFYAACDFLVHPSVIESFSMVCLEALSVGKPFICTDRIGITEYITPNREAFVIPPDNFGVLVQRMNDLVFDQELRRRMGQAGLETAKKLQWSKIAPYITRIYDRLVADEQKSAVDY